MRELAALDAVGAVAGHAGKAERAGVGGANVPEARDQDAVLGIADQVFERRAVAVEREVVGRGFCFQALVLRPVAIGDQLLQFAAVDPDLAADRLAVVAERQRREHRVGRVGIERQRTEPAVEFAEGRAALVARALAEAVPGRHAEQVADRLRFQHHRRRARFEYPRALRARALVDRALGRCAQRAVRNPGALVLGPAAACTAGGRHVVVDAVAAFVRKPARAVAVGGKAAFERQQPGEIDPGRLAEPAGLADPFAGGLDRQILGGLAPGVLARVDDHARGRHQFFVVRQVPTGLEGALDRGGDALAVVDRVQRHRGLLQPDARRQGQAQLVTQAVLRNRAVVEAGAEPLLAAQQHLQFARARQFQNAGDQILCLGAPHQSRPRQILMPRNSVGAAPWVICATCIGSPLPQLVTPCARQKRSSQVASQAFQNFGVLLW